MSFFRTDSPPPRQPSPDIPPAPLPHPRHHPANPRIRVESPHSRGRTLHAMRSMDLRSERAALCRDLGEGPHRLWSRQRTQSSHTSSSIPTPKSSPRLSPCPSPSPVGYKRTLSVSIPSPTPSPTPTMVAPIAPPPKASVALPTDGIACPRPVSMKPFVFDQTEGLDITDRQSATRLLQKPSKASLKSLPPLEKHKNVGIACLRFFGIKSQSK